MDDTMTILQIPVEKALLAKVKIKAKEMGFGSVQDMVRYFLKLLVEGKVELKLIINQ